MQKSELVILIGRSGAGKSTFIDFATGRNGTADGHSLNSSTTHIKDYKCNNPRSRNPAVILDTPGFAGTSGNSEFQTRMTIYDWFKSETYRRYSRESPFTAVTIVWLHNIGRPRLDAGEELWPLCWSQTIASFVHLPRCRMIICTTKSGGIISDDVALTRESYLKSTWKGMIESGCNFVQFQSSGDSVWDIVNTTDVDHYFPPRVVILLGVAGSGKTTFIESATKKRGLHVGHGMEMCTSDIQIYECTRDGRAVIFVDTPGFDTVHKLDETILSAIADWLKKRYSSNIPALDIVYLHPVSDTRFMSASPSRNIRTLLGLCGNHRTPRVIVGTTMWKEVQPEIGERNETQIQDAWHDCGFGRFQMSEQSAWALLNNAALMPGILSQAGHNTGGRHQEVLPRSKRTWTKRALTLRFIERRPRVRSDTRPARKASRMSGHT